MRRGQMEMVGLAFIVVLLIIGVVVYLNVASTTHQELPWASSYLTALAETTVPSCGVTMHELATACIINPSFCNACNTLQETMEDIASQTLTRYGIRYNLSVDGVAVQVVQECESANPAQELALAQPFPIAGTSSAFVLAVC